MHLLEQGVTLLSVMSITVDMIRVEKLAFLQLVQVGKLWLILAVWCLYLDLKLILTFLVTLKVKRTCGRCQ